MDNRMQSMVKKRRTAIKTMGLSLIAGIGGLLGFSRTGNALATHKKGSPILAGSDPTAESNTAQPLFSGYVVHEGLVYVSGKGAHGETDIRRATTIVLDAIERDLVRAGSSMNRALKVTVFLDDLSDFQGMNESFRGRFGDRPPVRSTVACKNGIPGNSIVEIDCIAAIE